ncbi:Protein PELPK2 [Camellia lanceoleosa]|uniref:Protein PELPK2 n=1 Tax=Camellia lanceoleosa TaxID=1840588 RepID=A0ACC0IQ28_9ERIC|nr:Protein PELPK2 [Camellia lanceoleosa]
MAYNQFPSFVLPLLLISLASMVGNTILAEARHLVETNLPELPKPELSSLPKLPTLPEPQQPSIPKLEVSKLPELPILADLINLLKSILPTIPAIKDLPIPTLKSSQTTTTP